MSSIRDRIAAVQGGNTERVCVPEWDGIELEFRSITVKKRADLLQYAGGDGGTVDMVKFGPMLLVASVYDPETGEAAFSEADVDMLSEQPAGVIDRLAIAAMRVSGIDADALEAGKGDS